MSAITATAEDRSTTMTYTITVTRADTPPVPPDPEAGVVLMEVDSVTPFTEEITEGVTDTLQVTLAVEPTADSTVNVVITATDLNVVSGSPMDFTAGNWEEPQELVVSADADADAEPNEGDLMFSMDGDAGNGYGDTATVDHASLVDTVDVAIIETDTKGVNLTATGKEVSEATAGSYTVVLNSQPVGGNVNIELSGASDDVTMSSNQLTFTDATWNSPQTVTITPIQNTDTADYSAFALSHNVLGGGYTGIDVDDVDVQVLDDEAPQVVVTTTAVTVNEGGSFTYAILLTQAPSDGETVTMTIGFNTVDFTSTETTVTFNSGDTSEEVTITARNVTADAVKTITHTITDVTDTNTSEGNETVYSESDPASSTTVTVKNVPE